MEHSLRLAPRAGHRAGDGGSVCGGELRPRRHAGSGERRFRARLPRGAFAFTASPWAYNGKIFCLSEEGETYVLEAADELHVLRINALDEMALASPAIVGDRLLIRTQTRLYSIRRAVQPS